MQLSATLSANVYGGPATGSISTDGNAISWCGKLAASIPAKIPNPDVLLTLSVSIIRYITPAPPTIINDGRLLIGAMMDLDDVDLIMK